MRRRLGGRLPDIAYRAGDRALLGFAVLVLVAVILPIIVVFPVSLSATRYMTLPPQDYSWRWYVAYFQVPEWTAATLYSGLIGIFAATLAVGLGIPAAIGLSRAGFRGRDALTLLFIAPLVLPIVIMAISLYFAFAALGLTGTTLGLVLAHGMLALPFAVVVILAGLAQFDANLERAAASLGAGPLTIFRTVTLPLIRPAVLSAALLSFLASFNEFLIALFLVATDRVTLPIQFWKGLRFETNPTIAAVASMLIVLTIACLLAVEAIRRRAAAQLLGGKRRETTP